MDRIRFDVSGHMFAIRRDLLMGGPDTRLKELGNTDQDVVVLDRPPDVFGAILAMYQTGELHIPKTCCPGTFLLELDYWNIKPEKVATCCFFRLQRFTNQQDNLIKFRRNMQLTLEGDKRSPSTTFPTLNRMRDKLWSIVDYKEKTALSTLYFGISLLMILISICNLAFSTDPYFRRDMTNCERYEYMVRFGMDDLDLVADMLKADCGNATSDMNVTDERTTPPPIQVSDDEDYDFVEIMVKHTPASSTESTIERSTQPCTVQDFQAMMNLNGTNGTDITNRTTTVPCIRVAADFFFIPSFELKRIKIPNFKVPTEVIELLEFLTTIYFSVDICLRLISCPSLQRYFMSVVNLADTMALLGAYTSWFVVLARPEEEYEENWLDLLNYLQMLRSFRLFRLVMTFNISKVLVYSVEHSLKDGFIMILVLIAGMCTFSTCLYLSEDKHTVRTIPDAWYWSVITMTTVGYGDIVPQSIIGRFVACVCSISGVLVFSLTVPLFVNQFMTLYQYADMKVTSEEENSGNDVKNFIVTTDQQSMKK